MTRAIANAEPGFFKLRLVNGGPWTPAIIYRPRPIAPEFETFQTSDRWHHLDAEIVGRWAGRMGPHRNRAL